MRSLLLLVLVLVTAVPAAAQWRAASLVAPAPAANPPRLAPAVPAETSDAVLIAGGLLGGAVGLAGGSRLGYALETAGGCSGDYFCGLAGGMLGALVGESLLLPLGVHLANGRRGSAEAGVLSSLGIGAAGLVTAALVAAGTGDGGATLLVLAAVPAVQLATAISLERRAERRRTGRPPTPAPFPGR